jgi:uncharacterized cupredoxin-like copper-binding protein
MHKGFGRVVSAAALLAAAGVATGCTSSGSSTPTGGSGGAASVSGISVMAIEKDYSISLSRSTFAPGPYVFVVENQGATAHNLNVRGPGIDDRVSATVDPHMQTQLAVTLLKGSYELWCSIDGHKDRGMDLTITVG